MREGKNNTCAGALALPGFFCNPAASRDLLEATFELHTVVDDISECGRVRCICPLTISLEKRAFRNKLHLRFLTETESAVIEPFTRTSGTARRWKLIDNIIDSSDRILSFGEDKLRKVHEAPWRISTIFH